MLSPSDVLEEQGRADVRLTSLLLGDHACKEEQISEWNVLPGAMPKACLMSNLQVA